ncbi:MAG: SDR family oxidoreductase [Bryobacteraceae bacterium]|nr:SDR family oxidoreductase [Bryobacteraceae bacterium]
MAQTVFLTGASTGIGRATAILFRDRGWNVAATMRNPAAHPDLASGGVKRIALDVTDPAAIAAACRQAMDAFGGVDVLVNNAGYGAFGPLEAASDEQIERQFTTNVTGLVRVIREFLPHFRERGSGVIVNISSVGGRVVFPLYSLYHATKWAVEGVSESLQFELGRFGIRVKVVEPGSIATDFAGRSLDRLQKDGLTVYDDYIGQLLAGWAKVRQPSPPELVAEVIYQAATDGSAQLRYAAGEDAKAILAMRPGLSDADYVVMLKQRFGID